MMENSLLLLDTDSGHWLSAQRWPPAVSTGGTMTPSWGGRGPLDGQGAAGQAQMAF